MPLSQEHRLVRTFFQLIRNRYKFTLLNLGIGRITAITFAKAGWAVVLFARRADRLQETVAQCPDSQNTLIVQGDVTDEVAVSRLFASAVERFGVCPSWPRWSHSPRVLTFWPFASRSCRRTVQRTSNFFVPMICSISFKNGRMQESVIQQYPLSSCHYHHGKAS